MHRDDLEKEKDILDRTYIKYLRKLRKNFKIHVFFKISNKEDRINKGEHRSKNAIATTLITETSYTC